MKDIKQIRLLIFGAGVIGSVYTVKFAEAGIDVTLFARNKRLDTLRQNDLQYYEKGVIKRIKVKLIDKLEADDIYDYILVPVRYDQVESALVALRDNRSKNIVTMTNISVGYDSWLNIVGDRLLPGFPSAGGDIKDGILHARFGPKFIQATIFGEINGKVTNRVKGLAEIFSFANLPYTIPIDISAFQITHAAMVVGMNKAFFTDNGIMDQAAARKIETLRNMVMMTKKYIRLLEKKGIPITPPKMKLILKCPDWLIISVFRKLMGTKFMTDTLLGEHAVSAKNEILLLDKDFLKSF